MDPLMQAPDALMRGILLHDVLESFLTAALEDPAALDARALTQVARDKLAAVPFPTTRALWQARIARVAEWFVTTERERQARATPSVENFEKSGKIEAEGVTLTGTADRIDIDAAGNAVIYDYKTGTAPSKSEQEHFDKQLLLEAAMIERHAFPGLAPRHVSGAVYVSLKPGDPKEVPAPLEEAPPDRVWDEFVALLRAYADPAKGYSARRALQKDNDISDYDQLSRFGEWDVTDLPQTEVLE
jgi:RecB family exonuclease